MLTYRISSVVLALVVVTGCQRARAQDKSSYNALDLLDKSGNIRKPADYRDRYQTLGTFAVVDLKDDHAALYVRVAGHG
jgi:hypothetical protein